MTVGGGQVVGSTLKPPSGRTSAPLAQPEPPVVAHVHVAGQSESSSQLVAFGVQCFVVDGVQLQPAGGDGAGSGTGAGGVAVPEGFAGVPPLGAPPCPEPDVPAPGASPGTLGPVEPPHAHASGSCTHVNPSPQLASVVHGSSYSGTHVFMVVVVQSGGDGGGNAQSAPGGHSQAGAGEVQFVDGTAKQTMPVAQSLCAWHGPGTHSLISCGSQGGVGGQLVFGAHAGDAHAVPPTT